MESSLARRKSEDEKKEEAKKGEVKKEHLKDEEQTVNKNQTDRLRGRVQSLGPLPIPAFGGRFFDVSLLSLPKIQEPAPISASASAVTIRNQLSSESEGQISPRSMSDGASDSASRKRGSSSSSPRILLTSSRSGRPVSPKGGAKLHSPKHSPRITIDCKESLIPEGELPFSHEIADMLVQKAREKFQVNVEDEKKKKTDFITRYGLSFIVRINAKDNGGDYLLVITGNYHSASNFYLLDKNNVLGEGASATVYMAYDLLSATKMAARMLRGELAKIDFFYLSKDINKLIVGKSFTGLFYGDVGFSDSTYVIMMPFVSGKPSTHYLYVLDEKVKEKHKQDYKDHPKYYASRILRSCETKIELIIAAMQAVQACHDLQIIHGDISLDNLLIERGADGYAGFLIDRDQIIDLGCDVFIANKEPTKENIPDFGFVSNAAYIRFGDNLYYVNKFFTSRSEVPDVNVVEFDKIIGLSMQPRRLSAIELEQIKFLTHHVHTAPRVGKINGAYSYVAPELFLPRQSEDPKPYATQKSDLYSLGVVILNVASDEEENFQYTLKQYFKKMMQEEKGSRQELHPDILKGFAPSIFGKYRIISRNFDSSKQTLDDYIDRFIANRFLLPKVEQLLTKFLSVIPEARVDGGGLAKAIQDFTTLRAMIARTAATVRPILSCQTDGIVSHSMRMINAITVMQEIGMSLDRLLPILRDPSAVNSASIEKLFAGIVPEVISPKSMPFDVFIGLKKAAEEKCQRKRSTAYEILKYLIEGWGHLKKADIQSWPSIKSDPGPKALLETLANYFALSKGSKEVFDFIGQLTQPALDEEKMNLRR